MHDLKAITPLGADTARVDQYDGLTVTENPDRAMASVSARQGQEEAFAKAASALLGADLPAVGQSTSGTAYAAFWIGPDSWMLDAPYAGNELIAADAKAAIGATGSVVEQTDGWCRFDLEGPRCQDVFERLCNVPIRTMQSGEVTRTRLEHLGCFVWCHAAGDSYSVIGPRSSAQSIHHAICAMAVSVI